MIWPFSIAWLIAELNLPGWVGTAYTAYEIYDEGKKIHDYFQEGDDMTMTNVGGYAPASYSQFKPPEGGYLKYWKTKAFATTPPAVGEYWVHFWKLPDGRIACWNERKNEGKVWRPRKHIVLSSNPRMSQIRKLERTYHKTIKAMAKKSDDLVLKSQVTSLRGKLALANKGKRK